MKKNQFFSLILISFLLFISCTDSKNQNNLKFSISYFKDLQENETIHSISTKEMLLLENPKIGFENGTYWFKVNLLENSNKKIIFDINESTIDNVIIYKDFSVIPQININRTHLSLIVEDHKQDDLYFFKVQFKYQVHFPLLVKEYEIGQIKEKYSFFFNGIYFGIVLMVLFVNLFFFFSLKDKTFLYYCLFLTAINLGILEYEGLLKLITSFSLLKYFKFFIHFLVPIFGAIFANHFLKLKYYLPKSNWIGLFILFVTLVFYLIFIHTEKYLFMAIANSFSLFVLLLYWILGIIVLRKHQFAIFFVIGYSLILFSGLVYVIPIDLGLKTFKTSLNVVKFGSVFEMLILTYAITYRIKILRKENEKYIEEIQKYLNKIISLESKNSKEFKIDKLIIENSLSNREADVLLLIFKGYTNPRIGKELFISLNTVKYHIRNIYQKLNIKNKNEAIDIMDSLKNSTK